MAATAASLTRDSPIALLRHTDLPHPERAVARGNVVRLLRSVYADAEQWRALAPWDRYLARVHAAARIMPDAVFCLESAAALSGLPVFRDPRVVHILVSASSTSREVAGVRAHTSRNDRMLIAADGIVTTSLADTAVDMARHRHAAVALAVADAALRADRTLAVAGLLACNEARASSRGRNLARWPLGQADARAESTLESVSRAVISWLGLPRPALQTVFRSVDSTRDRSDFFWPEASVAGEADGDVKYDGSLGDPVAALRARRDRDIRLLAQVRSVTHWGWAEVTAVAPIRSILRSAGVEAVAPEDTAQLHSLRRLLSPR